MVKFPKARRPDDIPTGAVQSMWNSGAENPGTVALRWCSECRRFLGVKLWPQTGRPFVHTHGLCSTCFERMTSDAFADSAWPGADRGANTGEDSPL